MAIKDEERRKRIAGKLRGHRAEAGLSQAKLGEAIAAEKDSIGRYERGLAAPSVETAWELADLYGVSIDELVGRKFDPATEGEVI